MKGVLHWSSFWSCTALAFIREQEIKFGPKFVHTGYT
jgi:hypothetical protein